MAPRLFGTGLAEEESVVCAPLDVLHTWKHRRCSWHIWPYIQGRTINFTQKGPPRVRYTGCAAHERLEDPPNDLFMRPVSAFRCGNR